MGDVVQFIPKSERERLRLIREARAIYDSIFPPSEPEKRSTHHAAGGGKAYRDDGALRS